MMAQIMSLTQNPEAPQIKLIPSRCTCQFYSKSDEQKDEFDDGTNSVKAGALESKFLAIIQCALQRSIKGEIMNAIGALEHNSYFHKEQRICTSTYDMDNFVITVMTIVILTGALHGSVIHPSNVNDYFQRARGPLSYSVNLPLHHRIAAAIAALSPSQLQHDCSLNHPQDVDQEEVIQSARHVQPAPPQSSPVAYSQPSTYNQNVYSQPTGYSQLTAYGQTALNSQPAASAAYRVPAYSPPTQPGSYLAPVTYHHPIVLNRIHRTPPGYPISVGPLEPVPVIDYGHHYPPANPTPSFY